MVCFRAALRKYTTCAVLRKYTTCAVLRKYATCIVRRAAHAHNVEELRIYTKYAVRSAQQVHHVRSAEHVHHVRSAAHVHHVRSAEHVHNVRSAAQYTTCAVLRSTPRAQCAIFRKKT